MGMTLNTIWSDFCRNIQASETNDIDRKIAAINNGQKYLLDRCIELLSEDVIPKDFLSDPVNLANTASSHRLDLPSDFKKAFAVWRKTSSNRYYPLEGKSIVTYDQYKTIVGDRYFDTTDTGDIQFVAFAEPYMYLDKYITDVGTDNIKLQYYKTPSNIEAYERIGVVSTSGLFQADEVIQGATSGATATIYTIVDDLDAGFIYINIYTKNLSGTFQVGETITGQVSGATATISNYTNKPETLVLTEKYKLHLIEAAGLQYHIAKGSDEIEGRSLSVDNFIMNINALNQNKVQIRWGFYDSVR